MNKYQTYSSELKLKLIEEYLTSHINQRKFAEQNGVNFHTLNSWITKYNKSKKETKAKGKDLVSLIPLKAMVVPREELEVAVNDSVKEKHSNVYARMKIHGISFEINVDDIPLLFGAMSHD